MQRRTHGDPEVTLEMVTDHGVHQEEVLTVVILATDQGASPEVEATTTDGMIVVEHLGEVARVQGVHQEEVLTVVIVAADQGASPEVEATTADGKIIVEHPAEVARDQGVGEGMHLLTMIDEDQSIALLLENASIGLLRVKMGQTRATTRAFAGGRVSG
jgi:phosphotransferase system HPr-like phosphotransfer protein